MSIDWSAFTPLSAIAGGVLLGLGAGLFVMANGRIAGISGLLAGTMKAGRGRDEKTLFLLGMLCASVCWGLLSGWPQVSSPGPAGLLLAAGLLVGLGSRYASGCTSGHGVCGLARLSPRSLVAIAGFMVSGFLTVYLSRHLLGGISHATP